ncbi:MAG: trypsin-like peptidase domain-containing protein, partial [Myxococcales bacterium]|nr:trypsin-like peptidase domain-containing protein [Myxococcales bacterium]
MHLSRALALAVLLVPSIALGQSTTPGTPASFGEALGFPPEVDLPAVDVAGALVEDALLADEKLPTRFGLAIPTSITPDTHGEWTQTPDGTWIWRVAVRSADAYHLNFRFDRFSLPAGAELYLYSADGSQVLGALTSRNHKADGGLSTGLVRGDTVILEYVEPRGTRGTVDLRLSTVYHGYRQSMRPLFGFRDFGDSDTCEIDVICESSDGRTDTDAELPPQRRGVARVLVVGPSSAGWCSGTLINNTANDGRLLFLTANHCMFDGQDPGDTVPFVFDFQYRSPDCAGAPEPPADTVSTATVLARSEVFSDFSLLELSRAPTTDPWMAGWNRSATAVPDSAFGIHHPSGDVQMISRIDPSSPPSSIQRVAGPQLGVRDLWEVVWDSGVTEGGSSGSPLFDEAGSVVGQLLGGSSFCSTPTFSDIYGRLDSSWDGDGAVVGQRLSDFLDPDGLGDVVLAGSNLSELGPALDATITSVDADSLCDPDVALSATLGNL